ncbi:uncharacterized protein Z520_02576 [Fonsecaea multimorphosa CBS 102226]|uniref:FAD-binding FR-type domain-containing protein n=1 Tax=Fonsecaea multimorphosa CBS 102226 TaxID=1442371 RepID=A0A0D2IZG7_9EURO|nr:uncharacterized protein Z520_02576 [Fonsecaea multimorphosa CBS 102226]KIY02437.1 hypothetical protein Z520_02576 [Fonsecaea multimorphosa CBS 102226]OAL29078.1 hypothetical protein AYO22_02515 [Fonsecaea multimorphosa]
MDNIGRLLSNVLNTTSQLLRNHANDHLNQHRARHSRRDLADGNMSLQAARNFFLNSTKPTVTISNLVVAGGNPPTVSPFYTGLNGVNLEMDAQLVRMLWLSIIVALTIVFALRLSQLFVSYIRNIYCMTTEKPSQQNYYGVDHFRIWTWLKKHIIYAPLWKKRHNREFQLSGAVNYGTLPSRIHSLLLVIYAITNLIYCLLLDWRNPQRGALYAELRGRSGILATVNLIPLIVLAGRNNIAIPLLRVSFDTFNLFHRWIGRLVAALSTIHFCAWLAAYKLAKGDKATIGIFHGAPFLDYGLLGLIAIVLLPLHSLSPIRHAFYETFLHLHQSLAFMALLGVYVHLDIMHLPAYPSILAAILLLFAERVWRICRIAYLNYSRSGGTTTAHVEALPGGACRVTFQLPRHITIRPGSHVYAYLPSISLWMSHPFSVAWTNVESEAPVCGGHSVELQRPSTPNSLERQSSVFNSPSKAPTTVSLIMVARTGMTRKLYERARAAVLDGCQLSLRGFLEGPYAGHDSLVSYGTVVMFAGGGGITHHLIQIRHLLAGARSQTVATRKIVLVWSIRDTECMEWVKPWMNEILHMEGRREVLCIRVHVTKPTTTGRAINTNKSKSKPTMQVVQGRVDPGAVLDEVIPVRVGAVMVSVCGPGALADEVRAAVRSRIHRGNLELNEESFTW